MSDNLSETGPCDKCQGSGQLLDRRIGDIECDECQGHGWFNDGVAGPAQDAPHHWVCAIHRGGKCTCSVLDGAAREARVEPIAGPSSEPAKQDKAILPAASAAPVEAVEVLRAKFEAWASARGANIEHHRHKPDEYATMATQERWTIWSAAVASVAQPPQPLREVLQLKSRIDQWVEAFDKGGRYAINLDAFVRDVRALRSGGQEDERDAKRWRQWRKGTPLVVTLPNPNKPGKFTTISYGPNNEPAYGDCLDAAIDATIPPPTLEGQK